MATEHEAARNDDDDHPPRDTAAADVDVEFSMPAELRESLDRERRHGCTFHVRLWPVVLALMNSRDMCVTDEATQLADRNVLHLNREVFTAKGTTLRCDDRESHRTVERKLRALRKTIDGWFIVLALVTMMLWVGFFDPEEKSTNVGALLLLIGFFVVVVVSFFADQVLVRFDSDDCSDALVPPEQLENIHWRWRRPVTRMRLACQDTADVRTRAGTVYVPGNAWQCTSGRVVFLDLGVGTPLLPGEVVQTLDEVRRRLLAATEAHTSDNEDAWAAW